MPRFDLATMARRQRNIRRDSIVIRDIAPPATLATNLYRQAYSPVIAAWQSALPRILTEFERTISTMTQDSPADVGREVDAAATAINRLILTLTPEVRDWALRTEQWWRGRWRGAVLSATGVDLTTLIGAEDVRASLETSIEWNTSLIRDVSDQVRQRVGSAVFDGLRNRTPAREVGKAINDAVGVGKARSQRIAADQLTKLTSSLAEERRREAGIDTWKWRSSHKLNYRPEHASRDGKEYTDATAPKDRPGQLPYCGCRGQAVLKFD